MADDNNPHHGLERFLFSRRKFITNDSFEDVGFGPFTVQRKELLEEILKEAKPKRSVHVSGCRGAGKSIVLVMLGQRLIAEKKTVYFFDNASRLTETVNNAIRSIADSMQEAYLLIDETQENTTADVWTPLLKNTEGHKITTIGAGVPKFNAMAGWFKTNITTDRLFLSSAMLVSENILQHFCAESTTESQREQIKLLLEEIRSYVGGHIYPLMALAEQLVPGILAGDTAETLVHYLHSSSFRDQKGVKDIVQRVLPEIYLQDFRSLLTLNPPSSSLKELQRHGLIDKDNTVISQFLFDEYIKDRTGTAVHHEQLAGGIAGVQQLLKFACPNIQWRQYQVHGGPIEDALTFELLVALSRVSSLDTRLFNPKLVNYNAGRKPDLYLNTTVGSYVVECVLTTANSERERKKLDEHISRFYWEAYSDPSKHKAPPYYATDGADFAVLNFQNYGDEPMEPFDDYFRAIYRERVFTFVMSTRCLYWGDQLLA